MSNITVNDVAASVAEFLGMKKEEAEKITKQVFMAVAENLAKNNEVSIHGFGKFSVRGTAARVGRNPATGGTVQIAAGKKATFKPAQKLKESLV